MRPDGERLAALEQEMRDVRADIKEIKESQSGQAVSLQQIAVTLATAKGGWKVLLAVGILAGSIGSFLGHILPFWRP